VRLGCFFTYMGEVMNIIELAKQVGYPIQHPEWQKATEEFAALVEAAARADEREAVIKLLIELKVVSAEGTLIETIRARGTT
jgi:hypothetical protein